MKKNLLLLSSLLVGVSVNAQFTQDNAPKAGDEITLYVIDSLAPNMASETGTNANWNYSSYLGYDETRLVKVSAASTTPFAADFPNSGEAFELQGLLTSFTTDDASGRMGQGFVFSEPSLGNIVAVFEDDPEQLYTYPFDVGDSFSDAFAGVVKVPPFFQDAITGSIHVEVDGKGTLTLADNAYSDVLRYKLVDTMYINGVPVFGDLKMMRVQYEYYDHASGNNLPIFVHANITIVPQSGGSPISDMSIVLSKENPDVISVGENVLENINIYPNPTKGDLTIQMPENIGNTVVVITDAVGHIVYSADLETTSTKIDVSNLKQGVYFAKISNSSHSIVKNIVVQ